MAPNLFVVTFSLWKGRALIAVANSILTAGYYMLHPATTYQDLGPDYFDKRNTVRATHRMVKRSKHWGKESSSNPASSLIQAVRRDFLGRRIDDPNRCTGMVNLEQL